MRSSLLRFLLGAVLLAGCESAPTDPDPAGPQNPDPPDEPEEPNDPDPAAGGSYVVLLSLDGFHPDYFRELSTTHLARVAQRGVVAEALEPVFPTLTFPNHLTLVTGLYPEHHGIVSNSFFDPQRGEWYSLSNAATVTDGTWYRGEPIWSTAERQGVRAASFFWAGSEAEIAGYRPSYWKVYNGSVPNTERVDTVLSWLTLPDSVRPRLVTLYMSDVDGAGHAGGPDSPGIQSALNVVDFAIGRLLDGLDAMPQGDSTYVVIVSDHGMARYEAEHVEIFDDYADMTGVTVGAAGPFASLHVTRGDTAAARLRDELNGGLQHGRAYLRADVPADLHYRADPRIGDVVVVMDAPWQIRSWPLGFGGGHHGWAPSEPSMQGIFMALGPDIPSGTAIGRLRAVDVHAFLAELLGIEPAEGIDGAPGAIRAAIGS